MHPSASSYFLLCFYFSFPPYKKCSKNSGKSDKKSAQKNLPEEPEGGQRATTRGPGALVARQGGAWTPGVPPGCPLSPIYSPSRETLEDRTLFRDLTYVPPPPCF